MVQDDPTRIRVEARAGGRTASGSIAFVENQVDLTTGTVTAKALMQNGSEQLWPGAFVPVKVTLGSQPTRLSCRPWRCRSARTDPTSSP